MAEPKNVVISPPNFATASVRIRGTAPFVQLRFSKKTEEILLGQQMDGQKAKNRKTREAKNPPELYEAAMYRTPDGRRGIPASAFRNAMIRACTVAGYTMTAAKMTVFIEADGYDADDGTPLVFFSKGDSHMVIHDVRNATGVIDLRVRAMWDVGWEAVVRVTWDANQFDLDSVVNLLHRAGMQVGVGEGRPSSKNSAGMGWGTFTIAEEA